MQIQLLISQYMMVPSNQHITDMIVWYRGYSPYIEPTWTVADILTKTVRAIGAAAKASPTNIQVAQADTNSKYITITLDFFDTTYMDKFKAMLYEEIPSTTKT